MSRPGPPASIPRNALPVTEPIGLPVPQPVPQPVERPVAQPVARPAERPARGAAGAIGPRGLARRIAIALLAGLVGCSGCTSAPAAPTSSGSSGSAGPAGPADASGRLATASGSGVDPAGPATGSAGFAGGDGTTGTGPGAATAAPPVDATTAAAVAAAAPLLSARSAALAQHDRAAWLATVADPDSADGQAEAAAFDALRALGVAGLVVGTVAPAPVGATGADPNGAASGATSTGRTGIAGQPGDAGIDDHDATLAKQPPQTRPATLPGAVRVVASLGYRIPGVDRGDRVVARTVTLAPVGAEWRIVRWRGARDLWEVFDLAGLSVARTDRVVVAGPVPVGQLLARLADAEFAQTVVGRALGSPVPALLVEPASQDQLAALLGRSGPGEIGPIAASTIGPRDPGRAALADRVVLNPESLAQLTDAGRRVVLAHELTHVAIRATTGHDLPIWLSEGFAEWVAFAPVALPPETVAARLLAQVRDHGAPLGLPTEVDFTGADPATAYQSAWLAVSDLAARIGPAATVAFVRSVAGTPADGRTADRSAALVAAFHQWLRMSEAEFVTLWRAGLVARARP